MLVLILLLLLLLLLLYYRYSVRRRRRVDTTEVVRARRTLSPAATTICTVTAATTTSLAAVPTSTILVRILGGCARAVAQLLGAVVLEVSLGVAATASVPAVSVVRVCHRVLVDRSSFFFRSMLPLTCTVYLNFITLFTVLLSRRGHSNKTRNPLNVLQGHFASFSRVWRRLSPAANDTLHSSFANPATATALSKAFLILSFDSQQKMRTEMHTLVFRFRISFFISRIHYAHFFLDYFSAPLPWMMRVCSSNWTFPSASRFERRVH